MKTIGIDARFYGTEQKGLGRYVQKLIEELALTDAPHQFKIFLNKKGLAQYKATDSRFTPVLMDVPWYGLREQREVPRILKNASCDLVHFPHFNIPYAYKQPYVVTIHDLILFDHPSRKASKLSWPLYQLKYAVFKANLRHSLKLAKQILTVSEHTKSRVVHYFPWTQEKISVTRIAPGHTNSAANLKPADLGIHAPYVLYVGNAYPHKNLEFLVRAFHTFTQTAESPNLQLILVGKLDYFYFRLQDLINSLNWPGNRAPVRLFGYATESQLASLYQNASAYVFPSLEEGFGIPPLEAMQYGVPVLSSNQGSMPEILEQAALYFDPRDSRDFIARLKTILTDHSLRSRLVADGHRQTAKYSWQTCAKQSLASYESALESISRK